jgi:lysophospholipase L1-like esterase
MNKRKKVISLLLTGTFLVALPFNTFAKESGHHNSHHHHYHHNKKVEYVALGDSLAAGQTPYGKIDLGYPAYLAERFKTTTCKIDFDNFGVPGYNSVQLKDDVLNDKEVRKEIKEASHITIDIGANDLLPVIRTNPAQAGKTIENVSTNVQTILSTIDRLNRKADVYVMGYFNPFPYYPQQQQAFLLPLLHALNDQIELRTKLNGDTFVPTEAVIAQNYQKYMPNPLDIHLSLIGYKAVSNEFWKAIDEE